MTRRLRTILQFSIAVLAVSAPAFALTLSPDSVAITPEPATAGLIGAGIAALFGVRYYRSRKR